MEKLNLNHIRDLIINGNVQGALEELLDILQGSRKLHSQLRDDIIMLRTQLNDVERKENLNLISLEEAGRERAQLQKGILAVINSMEFPSYAPAVNVSAGSGGDGNSVRWKIAGVAVLLVLILSVAFGSELLNSSGGMPTAQQEQQLSEKAIPVHTVAVDTEPTDSAQPNKENLVDSEIESNSNSPKQVDPANSSTNSNIASRSDNELTRKKSVPKSTKSVQKSASFTQRIETNYESPSSGYENYESSSSGYENNGSPSSGYENNGSSSSGYENYGSNTIPNNKATPTCHKNRNN